MQGRHKKTYTEIVPDREANNNSRSFASLTFPGGIKRMTCYQQQFYSI